MEKKLYNEQEVPIKDITPLALEVNADGMVLLENDDFLPLKQGDRVSVFGRMQSEYNHGGTGSGGLINIPYKTNIYDELEKNTDIVLNKELRAEYLSWIEKNPYDKGTFWPGPPWSQKEMPVTEEMVERAATVSDKAIVIIARTAGEDNDNTETGGSYLLSDVEYEMLRLVSEKFKKVCVILNVSNIIDMKWVKELNVGTVLYAWQGGQDGGKAVADVLCGKMVPSGKLTDTICRDICEHPSAKGFFEEDEVTYVDDIYVGYRYFETFAQDKVMYPFGYGIGYTKFDITMQETLVKDRAISISADVKNCGNYPGKETLQVYFGADTIDRPAKELIGFAKSKLLKPGETERIYIEFPIADMHDYSEEKAAYILKAGKYYIYVGTDVRSAALVYTYNQEADVVTQQCKNIFNPNRSFEKMFNQNGTLSYETVLPRCEDVKCEMPEELAFTGDKGIKLVDVYNKQASLSDFVAQLSDYALACLSQGEGMNSPKVRPGAGGAFGGLTEELKDFGIPAICVTDGPSGLRLDNGDVATSLPIGTMLACTWNRELVEALYTLEGKEIYLNRVDGLLGPGMNIHKHPLCGRNFEYFSEDPYLTGHIAKAICSGLYNSGVTGTIKHFAANNRETNRERYNSLVSERALREIYLKPFEIVVKDKKTSMIMTAYNKLNGIYTAVNHDLVTKILRDEWHFDGVVMSDWWVKSSVDEEGNLFDDRSLYVVSQNDVYMVNGDVEQPACELMEALKNGKITRGQLQRNAMNILRAVMLTPSFQRFLEGDVIGAEGNIDVMTPFIEQMDIKRNDEIPFSLENHKLCGFKIKYKSSSNELAQIPVRIFANGLNLGLFAVHGTNGEVAESSVVAHVMEGERVLTLDFDASLIEILKIQICKEED